MTLTMFQWSDNQKAYILPHYLIIVIKMAEIPITPVKRLLRNAGAERISKDASMELARLLEEEATRIANEALIFARQRGRKTVEAEDITVANEALNFFKQRGRKTVKAEDILQAVE